MSSRQLNVTSTSGLYITQWRLPDCSYLNRRAEGEIITSLRPVNSSTWVHVPEQNAKGASDDTSLNGSASGELASDGILLEAGREVRAKVYIGEVRDTDNLGTE